MASEALAREARWAVRLASLALLLWLASRLRTSLLTLVLSSVLAVLLSPLADWVSRKAGGRRGVGASVAVGACLAAVAVAARLLAGPLGREVARLAALAPVYARLAAQHLAEVEARGGSFGQDLGLTRLVTSAAVAAVERVVGGSVAVGSHAYVVVLVPVLAFFLLKDGPQLGRAVEVWLPLPWRGAAAQAVRGMVWAVHRYLVGLLWIAAFTWLVLWVGLWRLAMPNPLGWSALVAAAETVPYLGPLFALVTLGTTAFARGVHTGVAVVLLLLAVRGAVDAVVAPLVFRNLLRLHPVVVVGSVLVGAELFGVLGAFLAAPTATAVATLLRSLGGTHATTAA
ncbi:MAG: AI-2E family transporter [Armatimonadota bacterium]|nr:AI-2E family transporter [Armatimonadota bacterium]